jgi:hypothetical protein
MIAEIMLRYLQSKLMMAMMRLSAIAVALTSARYYLVQTPLLKRSQILALSRHHV